MNDAQDKTAAAARRTRLGASRRWLAGASAVALLAGVGAARPVDAGNWLAGGDGGGLDLQITGYECRTDTALGPHAVVLWSVTADDSVEIQLALWSGGQQVNGRTLPPTDPGAEQSGLFAWEEPPTAPHELTATIPGTIESVNLSPPDCSDTPSHAAVGFETDTPEPGSEFIIHVRCSPGFLYQLALIIEGEMAQFDDGGVDPTGRHRTSFTIPSDVAPGTAYSVELTCAPGSPSEAGAGAGGVIGGDVPATTEEPEATEAPPATEAPGTEAPGIVAVPGPVTHGDAQVVAQGIVAFSDAPVRWDHVLLDPVDLPHELDDSPAAFFVADGPDAVLVVDDDGPLALLDSGEATFVAAGSSGSVATLFDDATASVQRITFTGASGVGAFAPGEGGRDVNLIRHVIAPGDAVGVTSPFPITVIADGELSDVSGTVVTADDGLITLGTTVSLTNDGTEPVTVLIAAVGGQVP